MMKEYTIYQLSDTPENRDRRFERYSNVTDSGDTVHPANYTNVYSGTVPEKLRELPEKELLEHLYTIFNTDHPKDFHGHSLSVSDVVLLSMDEVRTAYYVDSLGFIPLTSQEWKEPGNYLRAAELSMEVNDNMIDGIINNLPTDRQQPSESTRLESLLSQVTREQAAEKAAREDHRRSTRATEEVL